MDIMQYNNSIKTPLFICYAYLHTYNLHTSGSKKHRNVETTYSIIGLYLETTKSFKKAL